jgi:hypothetical protein
MDNELSMNPFQVRPLEQQKHSPITETNLRVCLWHELIQVGHFFIRLQTKDRAEQHIHTGVLTHTELTSCIN